jgi:hypothetical protein
MASWFNNSLGNLKKIVEDGTQNTMNKIGFSSSAHYFESNPKFENKKSIK